MLFNENFISQEYFGVVTNGRNYFSKNSFYRKDSRI